MRHGKPALFAVGLMLALAVLVTARAASPPIAPDLGTAQGFAVLGGTGVTNTGPTVLNGDLGSCPTPAMTGFPPGVVVGTVHPNDGVACGAQSDLTTAYNDAAGRPPTVTFVDPSDIGGSTLTTGVYKAPSSLAITGTLTLDAEDNANAVFIFQAASTLVTAPNSHVLLVNGAQPCNVFWQVGSSATLDVGTTFIGTILALTSITANTNATVDGRLLARNGAVTMDSNTITRSVCAAVTTTSAPPSTTTTTTSVPTSTTTRPTPATSTTSTTLLPTTPTTLLPILPILPTTPTTRLSSTATTTPVLLTMTPTTRPPITMTRAPNVPRQPRLPSTGSPLPGPAFVAGLALAAGGLLLSRKQARPNG